MVTHDGSVLRVWCVCFRRPFSSSHFQPGSLRRLSRHRTFSSLPHCTLHVRYLCQRTFFSVFYCALFRFHMDWHLAPSTGFPLPSTLFQIVDDGEFLKNFTRWELFSFSTSMVQRSKRRYANDVKRKVLRFSFPYRFQFVIQRLSKFFVRPNADVSIAAIN